MADTKYCRDEDVFSFEEGFQSYLTPIMKICGWSNQRLASLLSISQSSVNNYLGNSSMTNEKRSSMSEPQFITLLMYMQRKIIEQGRLSVAFAVFTYLCPGISDPDDDKLFLLSQNELNDVPKEMICSMYANWYPNVIRNINTFVDWQTNGKEKKLCEYKGINYITDLYDYSPVSKGEIELAEKNTRKIIPLYLKMYMADKNV